MELNPRFLSRLDIINILNSRHLHIPNIDSLTYEELLRIFKTFAVPLEQRGLRDRYIPCEYWEFDMNNCQRLVKRQPRMTPGEAQRMIEEHRIYPEETPHLLQQTKYLKLSFNTLSNQAPKRYGLSREEMPGGPTPPKRLMIYP